MEMVLFVDNDTATTEIYTLSLHDALPISASGVAQVVLAPTFGSTRTCQTTSVRVVVSTPPSAFSRRSGRSDRKSTRLNSSHANISYAVFCLKKKNLLLI